MTAGRPSSFGLVVLAPDGGFLVAYEPSHDKELHLIVARASGRPVENLEPYLAAYVHLVALRAGDLAYLHVHPDGERGDGRTLHGPDITFYADVPTTGTYQLFLDFQHEGAVRTAAFTATTAVVGAP